MTASHGTPAGTTDSYIIWDQRIWSVARAREGWRRMVDAGSATANHKDHVHVSYWRTPRDDTFRP